MLRKIFISPDESGGELWETCQTHQVRSHHKASGLRVETFYKTFQVPHQIQALLTLSRRDALWHLRRSSRRVFTTFFSRTSAATVRSACDAGAALQLLSQVAGLLPVLHANEQTETEAAGLSWSLGHLNGPSSTEIILFSHHL